MVFMGVIMALTGVLHFYFLVRKKEATKKRLWLKWLTWLTPAGFIAVEAGWIVTEVGRQPWIIYGIMKTKDSVTPMPGIQYSFYLVTLIYISLSVIVYWLMKRQINSLHNEINLSHE
jgi:cytochrome d ubiquinol oxidase subunit I